MINHFRGIFCHLQGFNKFINIATDHCIKVIRGEANAVIGHPPLWPVIGSDFGTSIAGTYQCFPPACNFCFLFAYLLFANPLVQILIIVFGIFHAINGLRITIFDLFPKLIRHYRIAINVEWVAYALLCGFAIFVVLRNAAGG